MKNCARCKLDSFLKTTLDNFDHVFQEGRLTPEALEAKKEVRTLFMDGCNRIYKSNYRSKESELNE